MRDRFSKTVLVVDESSLASSEQMRGLLWIATTLRVPRVVLVGDEKQLGAVEAGKPFEQLRRAGMQTAVMDEILRQRDIELMEAVRAGLAGEVRTAFEKLGERIAQVEREDIGGEVAGRWLSLSPEERAATGVIAPTRALRDEINETIRAQLVAEGAVSGLARHGEKLVSRGLTNAEMARASNYSAGDTVIFNRGYKTLGVEKGDERQVERVDYERNTVWLQDGNGNLVDWRPYMLAGAKGGVEVYRNEEMELRRGDRVRWTRNDPGSELANGETAAVESVGRDGVLLRLEDGSATRLAEGDPQLRHLDRAWASTVHAFQGRTVDGIVGAMPTGNPDLTNQRAFYVAISRARDHAELVTDDAGKLYGQLERATGERIAALDGVAKEAASGLEPSQDRDASHADRMDRGHETELQTDRSTSLSIGRGMNLSGTSTPNWRNRVPEGTGRVSNPKKRIEKSNPKTTARAGRNAIPSRKRRSIWKKCRATWTSNCRDLPSLRPTPGPRRTTRSEPNLALDGARAAHRDSTVARASLLLPAHLHHAPAPAVERMTRKHVWGPSEFPTCNGRIAPYCRA